MAQSDGQVVFTVTLDDSAFQTGMARLQSAVAGLGQGLTDALTVNASQLNAALSTGRLWAANVAGGMRSSGTVQNAAKSVVSGAAAAARAVAQSGGTSVGSNLVSGMAAGVYAQSGALSAAVKGVVLSALAAAKKAAGIASPSKLFRDEVGRYLALGIGSGFTGAMESTVLPAMSSSVRQSAAAGRKALDASLAAGVAQSLGTKLTLPSTARISMAVLPSAAMPTMAAATAAGKDMGAVTVTQNITFASAMQAPDEVARAIRRQATYGLAAARS